MKLREAEMGDGTEPVYNTDHNRQAEDTLDEQQYAEEQGSLKATSSMPRDTDILVGKGNIKDGSAFGQSFVIVKHKSSKGNDYLMLYQQVGFVSRSKAQSKTDWRGEIVLDSRSQAMIQKDKCVMFGYDGESSFGKYTKWDIVQAPELNEQSNKQVKDVEFDDDIPF
tara:strand:- start:356 stop:856 length:501 start_codon:yes stop_codon:yes gene_type:complete